MNKEKDGSEFALCSKAQQNQFLQQKPQTSNYFFMSLWFPWCMILRGWL